MEYSLLAKKYQVISLSLCHIPEIYALCVANTEYYCHMGIQPTCENLEEVFTVCPQGLGMENKHFLGYFDDAGELVAILDLCTNYPQPGTAYIGWFMVRKTSHRSGIGSTLMGELFSVLARHGYQEVRLGCIKGNLTAMGFWTVLGFRPTDKTIETELYTIQEMAISLVASVTTDGRNTNGTDHTF